MYGWGGRDRDQEEDEEGVKIQLLSSSSVAVSTSQDFDDNATITAFWEERQKAFRVLFCSRIQHRRKNGFLLFQSPWHRVCLFCVCTPDWRRERLHRRETKASLSV